MFDLIVVGGGVVGAAAAYRSVGRGARTLLVDRHHEGRATDAGAGIVSPETEIRDGSPRQAMVDATPAFYAELIDAWTRRRARHRLRPLREARRRPRRARSQDPRHLPRAPARPSRPGVAPAPGSIHEIEPKVAHEMFPVLGSVTKAFVSRNAARVDGRQLTAALLRAAERRGLERESFEVETFVGDERVTGVTGGALTIDATAVLIAGGAWTPALGDRLGVSLPVVAERGQIAHLHLDGVDTAAWPVLSPLHDHYMVAWPGGRVACGATHDASGSTRASPSKGCARSSTARLSVAPGLADATLLEVRVGLRPISTTGLPLLGALPGSPARSSRPDTERAASPTDRGARARSPTSPSAADSGRPVFFFFTPTVGVSSPIWASATGSSTCAPLRDAGVSRSDRHRSLPAATSRSIDECSLRPSRGSTEDR